MPHLILFRGIPQEFFPTGNFSCLLFHGLFSPISKKGGIICEVSDLELGISYPCHVRGVYVYRANRKESAENLEMFSYNRSGYYYTLEISK